MNYGDMRCRSIDDVERWSSRGWKGTLEAEDGSCREASGSWAPEGGSTRVEPRLSKKSGSRGRSGRTMDFGG